MTLPPWLVLSAVLALALALLYQLVTKRFGWRLIGYWLLTFAGLLAAEAACESFGVNVTRYGDLRVLPDGIGAISTIAVLWLFGL